MSVPPYRRLAVTAGTALLATAVTCAVTGCSGLGRAAVGTLVYKTEQQHEIQVTTPSVTGCHKLPNGAVEITNHTVLDLVAYPTADCTGGNTTYIATTLSDVIAPGAGPWRSYSIVH
ncbi:hypothetical protein AB0O07_11325 [Streptomyces sp. NPDC093085]|uniref:hypothetical protein n=1 Tax=Streptomyces sp. NPDC093085 TaxID=3155068 RepID=UPI00343C820A